MTKRVHTRRYEFINDFGELQQLLRCVGLVEKCGQGRVEIHGEVACGSEKFPILSLAFGADNPCLPTLLLCAGVHGLERVTTQVLGAWLWSVIHLLQWNRVFYQNMTGCRLLFYPLANPGGMFLGKRSNPKGVDLMRNAPVDADKNRLPLVGGHRLTPTLPWYRGKSGDTMELESRLLCEFVKRECFCSELCIALDVHSGFGLRDRIWFPFAGSTRPFPDVAIVYTLKHLLDQTYPNHPYVLEPQSQNYTAHGDLWDYLYNDYKAQQTGGHFIPLSLELGSWLWAFQNPRQLRSILGLFNPMAPNRLQPVMRRHILLFEFLLRAVQSPSWTYADEGKKP